MGRGLLSGRASPRCTRVRHQARARARKSGREGPAASEAGAGAAHVTLGVGGVPQAGGSPLRLLASDPQVCGVTATGSSVAVW